MSEHLSPGVLHLYPGQKVLAFIVRGRLKAWAIAWGGPAEEHPRGPDEPFGSGPTNPGRYLIWKIAPYTTKTWDFSKIQWNARLRPHPRDPNDALYETASGRWESVRKKTGIDRGRLEGRYYEIYGTYQLPKTWVFNDFGRIAIRYFRDRNKNRKLDPDEHLEGEMFHATPENEADAVLHPGEIPMYESHGCIHLKPAQRDKMIEAGIFARGRVLIIHKYNEKFKRKPDDPTAAAAAI